MADPLRLISFFILEKINANVGCLVASSMINVVTSYVGVVGLPTASSLDNKNNSQFIITRRPNYCCMMS
jgi:hypothetical protein